MSAETVVDWTLYASGEQPRSGDIVTKRGYKPNPGGRVVSVDADGLGVGLLWKPTNKRPYTMAPSDLVLVRGATDEC